MYNYIKSLHKNGTLHHFCICCYIIAQKSPRFNKKRELFVFIIVLQVLLFLYESVLLLLNKKVKSKQGKTTAIS